MANSDMDREAEEKKAFEDAIKTRKPADKKEHFLLETCNQLELAYQEECIKLEQHIWAVEELKKDCDRKKAELANLDAVKLRNSWYVKK